MATVSIIANGTTAVDSAEFTLAAGESTTLNLRGTPGVNQLAIIKFKDSAGTFTEFGSLNTAAPVLVLTGIGTYKVSRLVSATSFGVDRS